MNAFKSNSKHIYAVSFITTNNNNNNNIETLLSASLIHTHTHALTQITGSETRYWGGARVVFEVKWDTQRVPL